MDDLPSTIEQYRRLCTKLTIWWEQMCMKCGHANSPDSTRCERQKGTVTVACALTLVLITFVLATASPDLRAIIPITVQHVTIAVLAGQLVALTFSGRRENQ